MILNAIMLGLTRGEALERYDRIIDFAELREFEELKLKNYSSGMLVRLAFSVMIQVDADILLIDEVLAVGDAAFQQKCYDEFNRLRDEGRTVLLVTHDMTAVQRFCDRAMLLERGRVVMLDEAERVAARYFDLNFGKQPAEPPPPDPREEGESLRRGDGSAEILDGWFENARGEPVGALAQGEPCTLCTRVRFDIDVEDPFFGATFVDGEHHNVFAASTAWQMPHTGSYRKGEVVTLRIGFENWFAPGRYYVAVSVAREVSGQDILDHRTRVASVIVSGTRPGGGIVDCRTSSPSSARAQRPSRVRRRWSGPPAPDGCAASRRAASSRSSEAMYSLAPCNSSNTGSGGGSGWRLRSGMAPSDAAPSRPMRAAPARSCGGGRRPTGASSGGSSTASTPARAGVIHSRQW